MKITGQLLEKLTGGAAKDSYVNEIAAAITEEAPQYAVDDLTEMSIFLGQAAHETGGFRLIQEGWGPTKAQLGYEGREDLGNTKEGDGYRYRGRGIFQCTGRANYRTFGKKIGIDLEKYPDKAADPVISVKIAFEYWKSRNMNAVIVSNPKDPVLAVSIKINGRNMKTGMPNGLPDRRAYTAKARKLLGSLQEATPFDPSLPPAETEQAAGAPDLGPQETIVTPLSDKELIASLQKILTEKDYGKLDPNGEWGDLTSGAIMLCQKFNSYAIEPDALSLEDARDAKPFIAEARKGMTVDDVAKTDTEAATVIKKGTAVKIAGGAATAIPLAKETGLLDTASYYVEKVSGIKGALEPLAGLGAWAVAHVWFLLPIAGIAAFFLARKMQFNVVDAFKKGD